MTRRPLDPGTPIARYRVVSPLGAGGMGEVYLARDESLDRSVALKILPPDLVKNDERVRRFVQEAKSASSLNHPHIVTIYEIGDAEIGAGDVGAPQKIHFIAMELVSGHTLKTLIHQEKTDLKTLVRHLAQAADGLAKAHAAGIVHRDLKPENIMVTADGFAKVVDFGLAKLTETTASGTKVTSAPTEDVRRTGAGVVLGTVGYMSPEQVQGKTVDHRSDIFSLGCVLYEAATRQRPFQADSDVETLHKILKEKPQPIEELNPEVPGELRRIIRRCLAKSVDQRAQSMKDLALELAEIADEYDTLTASSGSGTRVSSGVMGEAPTSRRTRALVAASLAVAALALAVLAGTVWGRRTPGTAAETVTTLRTTRVLSSPTMADAILSPDGRQLVYTRNESAGFADNHSLWLHQLATDSDVQLLPARGGALNLLRFSADGNYVFFAAAAGDGRTAIFQLPAIGGAPLRRPNAVDGAWSRLTGALSPDGRMFARTVNPQERKGLRGGNRTVLLVTDLDTGQERTITTLSSPQVFGSALAWSPDGAMLASVVMDSATSGARVVAVAAADGHATTLGAASWANVMGLNWLGDGRGVIARVLVQQDGQASDQIWFVSYPEGEAAYLVESQSGSAVTSSADGRTLAVTQVRAATGLWVAESGNAREARELQAGVSAGVGVGSPVAFGSSVLVSRFSGNGGAAIWRFEPDSSVGRRLTPDAMRAFAPLVARSAGIVVFRGQERTRGAPVHMWRMTLEGGELRRLTGDTNQEISGAVSHDGATVLMARSVASGAMDYSTVWRVSGSGGEPEVFLKEDGPVGRVAFSPDGRWLLVAIARDESLTLKTLKVIPAAGGPAVKTWAAPDIASGSHIQWAPSGDAVDFVPQTSSGVANVWRQPVGGGQPRQLTTFAEKGLETFAWSPDGRYLFFTRLRESTDVVLITNFRPDGKTP